MSSVGQSMENASRFLTRAGVGDTGRRARPERPLYDNGALAPIRSAERFIGAELSDHLK